MNKILFPHPENVPKEIKEKVMSYVAADRQMRPSILKKIRTPKMMIPTLMMGMLLVGVVSYILSPAGEKLKIENPVHEGEKSTTISKSLNSDEQTLPSDDAIALEQKLDELDQLLNELDTI